MNLESLILNICELRGTYVQKFNELSKQKGDDLKHLLDLAALNGAIYALEQVITLVDSNEEEEGDEE